MESISAHMAERSKMHELPKPRREVTPEAAEVYRVLVERTSTLIDRLRVLREQSAQIRDQIERNRVGNSRSSELVEKAIHSNQRRPA